MKIRLDYDCDSDAVKHAISSLLVGTVTKATASNSGNYLTLTYDDGRQVDIQLNQCGTHYCDNTAMTLSGEPSGRPSAAR